MTKKTNDISMNVFIFVPMSPESKQKFINLGWKKPWSHRLQSIGKKIIPIEVNTEEKLAEYLYKNCYGEGRYIGMGWMLKKDKNGKFGHHGTKKKFDIEVFMRDGVIQHNIIFIRNMYHYWYWKKRQTDERAERVAEEDIPATHFGTEHSRDKF